MLVDILEETILTCQIVLKVTYDTLATLQFLIAIICNLLMIETLLQRKIRITSIGIYLLSYSLASLYGTILCYMRHTVTIYFNQELDRNSLLHCRLVNIMLNITLVLCLWSSAFVSVERSLLECFHFSVYRSRKCAIIVSVLLILLAIAAEVTAFTGWHSDVHPIVRTITLCRYSHTSLNLGIFDDIFSSMYIHCGLPWILHVLSILATLTHIIRRKIVFLNPERRAKVRIMGQQVRKHKDFLIPPLLIIICTLPHVLYDKLSERLYMDADGCHKTKMIFCLRLHIAIDFLYYLPQTIGFFTYIYPSKVYMKRFNETWTVQAVLVLANKLRCRRKESKDLELEASFRDDLTIGGTNTVFTLPVPIEVVRSDRDGRSIGMSHSSFS
jgi:hypothetical protein